MDASCTVWSTKAPRFAYISLTWKQIRPNKLFRRSLLCVVATSRQNNEAFLERRGVRHNAESQPLPHVAFKTAWNQRSFALASDSKSVFTNSPNVSKVLIGALCCPPWFSAVLRCSSCMRAQMQTECACIQHPKWSWSVLMQHYCYLICSVSLCRLAPIFNKLFSLPESSRWPLFAFYAAVCSTAVTRKVAAVKQDSSCTHAHARVCVCYQALTEGESESTRHCGSPPSAYLQLQIKPDTVTAVSHETDHLHTEKCQRNLKG